MTTQAVYARRWGIRLDGSGQGMEHLLRQHVALTLQEQRPYTLVEIGSAGCVSLRAFRDIISEANGIRPWRVIGIDLPEDKAWSLDMAQIREAFDGTPHILRDHDDVATYPVNLMYLMLLSDPRAYLRDRMVSPLDFVFIDGSHGKSAGFDFLAVEEKVAPGGLVVFHDYGEAEQGSDWQSYDREFIAVRSYVHRLGLASPCVTPRKGWRFLGEIHGSRHWGGDGNSCAVVQRTNEPLEAQPELAID